MMNARQAVTKLNALPGKDSEAEHGKADEILLKFLKDNGFEEVADAREAAEERCNGFYYA